MALLAPVVMVVRVVTVLPGQTELVTVRMVKPVVTAVRAVLVVSAAPRWTV